jgi:hypothetical protein
MSLFPPSPRLAIAVAALCIGSANAAPTVYFGENQSPAGTVTGAPVTARAAFLGALETNVSSQGFESYAANPGNLVNPLAVTFNGSAGALNATLGGGTFGVVDASFDTGLGRFNTTPGGSQWWLATDSFTITFDTAISAFGFYGTDIGDFAGQLTVTLSGSAGDVAFTIPHTVDGADGSLLFWGVIDPDAAWTSVSFGNTGGGLDGFGFDDMVIGDRCQISAVDCDDNGNGGGTVPEPGTLVLASVAALGAFRAGRRRRRAG